MLIERSKMFAVLLPDIFSAFVKSMHNRDICPSTIDFVREVSLRGLLVQGENLPHPVH
jgi:hypothetical protein